MTTATFPVHVYYEDTDHSGAVYHANYLKYMERAREHLLGPDALAALWHEQGTGFVVYRAQLEYKAPAVFGDRLEVRTQVEVASAWRLSFQQDVHRTQDGRLLVAGKIELACVGPGNQLIPIPKPICEAITEGRTLSGPPSPAP